MSNADLAVWTQPYYWLKAKVGSIISRFNARLDYLSDDSDVTAGLFMPSPTSEQLASHDFQVVWDVIKTWDISAPEYYEGYCGANGSHVALILNALAAPSGYCRCRVPEPEIRSDVAPMLMDPDSHGAPSLPYKPCSQECADAQECGLGMYAVCDCARRDAPHADNEGAYA